MAEIILFVAAMITLTAMVLSFIRLVIGPDIVTRTVAIDGMTIIAISFIAFVAHWAGRVIYLDVAMVYALISFAGIVAIARYLERGLS